MEIIQFDFLGLHLQEPMAMVTNGLLSLFSFYAFFNLKNQRTKAHFFWSLFYLTFAISTFFGVWGHALFQYFGIVGKFPCWITGAIANGFAAMGMLHFAGYSQPKKYSFAIVWIKSLLLLIIALITKKFVFVAIDAILTYIIYTGVYGFMLFKRGALTVKWMVIGVLVLLPSAFVFLLKLNIHRWLNKDDLSHLFMLGAIICFYIAMRGWKLNTTKEVNV
ncbi:MAG: hypothetical protein IT221_00345 [Fluviicola sp.]|nr:hypothetical protein [Fluviicola sp.]